MDIKTQQGIIDFIELVRSEVKKAFIYKKNELIIHPKKNIFFRIDNISDEYPLDSKVLEYLSRHAIKGVEPEVQQKMRNIINKHFERTFTLEELTMIYKKIGLGHDHNLTMKYLNSRFDINVLTNN